MYDLYRYCTSHFSYFSLSLRNFIAATREYHLDQVKSKTFPALSGQVHELEGSRIGSQFEAKVKSYYIML